MAKARTVETLLAAIPMDCLNTSLSFGAVGGTRPVWDVFGYPFVGQDQICDLKEFKGSIIPRCMNPCAISQTIPINERWGHIFDPGYKKTSNRRECMAALFQSGTLSAKYHKRIGAQQNGIIKDRKPKAERQDKKQCENFVNPIKASMPTCVLSLRIALSYRQAPKPFSPWGLCIGTCYISSLRRKHFFHSVILFCGFPCAMNDSGRMHDRCGR